MWACSLYQYQQHAPAPENAFTCAKQFLLDHGYEITHNDPDAGIVRAAKKLRDTQGLLEASLKPSGGVLQLHVGAGSGRYEYAGDIHNPTYVGTYGNRTRWVMTDADSLIARCSAASEQQADDSEVQQAQEAARREDLVGLGLRWDH
jgi:hypothetical protein